MEKASQKREGKKIDFFHSIPFEDEAKMSISRKGKKSLNNGFVAYLFVSA